MAKQPTEKPAKRRGGTYLERQSILPDGSALVRIADWVPKTRPATPNELVFADLDLRQRIWDGVLNELERGLSLNKACALAEVHIEPVTVLRWAAANDTLRKQYAASRLIGYTAMAEEVKDISDTPTVGEKVTEVVDSEGVTRTVVREDMLGHRRLQTDTRKWLLSKCLPKIYGDTRANDQPGNADLVSQLRELAGKLPV